MTIGSTDKKPSRLLTRVLFVTVCVVASAACLADIPLYDFRQPVRDGVVLVGMDCNRKTQSLEIGIFFASNPPQKRMDLWRTSDLVAYDPATNMVSGIRQVERNCTIGNDHYKLVFRGLPGAANAMWVCGAVITAKAIVWKNGRLIYEQELARCGVDESVRLARFVPGTDVPTLIKSRQ